MFAPIRLNIPIYIINPVVISALVIISSCNSGIDYNAFKNCRDNTIALWREDTINKTALFVFPHPDDEITCGGTIDYLNNKGWKTDLLTLTNGQPEEKAARRIEWQKSCQVLGFSNYELLDLKNNSWDSVLANKIDFWNEHMDSIENTIYHYIIKYQPSIVFTYDMALGGYGHPEHRLSALAVYNVFKTHKNETSFPVKKIMQLSLPEKLEKLMLANSEAYSKAQIFTGNTTLPEPNICFNIQHNWSVKRKAASAYVSQAKILKKFFLFPDLKDTTVHFSTFDKEYFVLIN